MENRANYALVGLFATVVIVAAAAFIYWFTTAGRATEEQAYAVVFEGSVTGLAAGTDVLFNGLRVGSVTNVGIDPQDPNQVVARISVDSTAPVKTDTRAILEIQGLTGGAYIQLLGGSPDAPALVPAEGEVVAVLRGQPSDLQSIVEGAGSIVESAESAFARIDSFLSTNEQRLSTTLANIENLSNSLAGFAAGAGQGDGVQGMVASLQQSIESANATFGRIETLVETNAPTLTATIENAEQFSQILSTNSEGINSFLAGLGETGDQIGPLATDLRALSADLRTLVEAVPPSRLAASLDGLEETIAGARSAVATIDTLIADNANSFGASLTNLQLLSETTAANAESLNAFLLGLGESGGQIGPLAEDLRFVAAELRTIVAAVPSERILAGLDTLESTIAGANATVGTIQDLVSSNADSVATTLANAEQLSTTLAANAEGIDSFLVGLGETGDQIGPLTSDLRLLSADLRTLVNAVPAEDIAASLAGLEDTIANANATFAGVDALIQGNAESLTATLANAEAFSESLAGNSEGVDAFLASLSDVSTQVVPLVEEVRTLSADLGAIARSVSPEQVAASVAGLEQAIDSANSVFSSVDTLLGSNGDSIASTLDNVERFSSVLAANSSGVDTFLASLEEASDEIGPLAQELRLLSTDLRALVEVVPPQQVAQTFSDVSEFANSLARNTDNIDAFFVDAGTLAANLSGVSEGLQNTLDLIDEASGAIDADIIANAMRNIDSFSVALGNNAENIDRILGNTASLTETLTGAAERIDAIIARVDGIVATEGGESLFADVSAAAQSIRQLADQLQVQTGQVTSAFTSFANTGLSDYAALADEARVAVQQLQRVLSEIERNPQVVVFGGETVRDFQR